MRTALFGFMLCACASGADSPPAADTDSVRGTIVISGMGPSPLTTLSRADSTPLIVTGSLEPELRRLDGAVVIVHGRRADSPRPGIEAARYEIVEIDGVRPIIGIVQADGTQLRVGNDTLALQGLTQPPPAGSTIWVSGARDGTLVRVRSWGIIRR